MKNSILYISISLIFLSLNACRCDKQEVLYPNGSEMYRYVFRDTSNWIYKNTNNNILDTITEHRMYRATFALDTPDKCIDLKKEVFYMFFRSSLYPLKNDYYFIDYNGIRLNGNGDFPYRGIEVYNRLVTVGDSTAYTKYADFINSINIENQTYNNVRKIEIIFSTDEYVKGTFLYWSPNIGIIRKEIPDGLGNFEYWNLINHEVKYY